MASEFYKKHLIITSFFTSRALKFSINHVWFIDLLQDKFVDFETGLFFARAINFFICNFHIFLPSETESVQQKSKFAWGPNSAKLTSRIPRKEKG